MSEGEEEDSQFKVTPYEVEGVVDYNRLIEEFGLEPIDREVREELTNAFGDHYMIRRGYFFSHRDIEKILDAYREGRPFYMYTGRGPSGRTHLGQIAVWTFTKHLQDTTGKKLIFQVTDDEKYLTKNKTFNEISTYTKENILDIIAVGFDPERTEILVDTLNANTLYPIAIRAAKRINFSMVRSVFGFEVSDNIGKIFFTSMQSAPAFLESKRQGKTVRCLIPLGVDQDPHFRLTRDVAPKLGYPKPSILHGRLLPSLQEGGKMSSSQPKTTIFTTDNPEEVEEKVHEAFTGGRATAKEQRELGGEPEICPIFLYEYYFLEPDDEKVEKIKRRCKEGKLLCGEHKRKFTKKVNQFLTKHQQRREKAKDEVDRFLVKD